MWANVHASHNVCPIINIQIHVNHHVIMVVTIMHHLQSLWPLSEAGTGISTWQKKKLTTQLSHIWSHKASKVEKTQQGCEFKYTWNQTPCSSHLLRTLPSEDRPLFAKHFPDTSASHWWGGYSPSDLSLDFTKYNYYRLIHQGQREIGLP